jgi:hypothetical protein
MIFGMVLRRSIMKFTRVFTAVLFSLIASPLALAGGHHGGGHYGGYHHGGRHFYGGVGIGFYGWGYPYPYYSPYYSPYYGYPYYTPPVIINTPPAAPSTYIQQTPPPAQTQTQEHPAGYWYYCTQPEGYYPYVKECSVSWQQVEPTPPPPETQKR